MCIPVTNITNDKNVWTFPSLFVCSILKYLIIPRLHVHCNSLTDLFQFQVKVGLVLKIVCVLILVASTETLGEHLYKLHTVPTAVLLNVTSQNASGISTWKDLSVTAAIMLSVKWKTSGFIILQKDCRSWWMIVVLTSHQWAILILIRNDTWPTTPIRKPVVLDIYPNSCLWIPCDTNSSITCFSQYNQVI